MHYLHTSDRLIILHIGCILVFTVYCFLFVFFLYHSLMNKVAQYRHIFVLYNHLYSPLR